MTEGSGFYFVGIGGIGMSAIAKTALERGMSVQGSDSAPSSTTQFLQNLGAKIHFNQGTSALPKDATLVVSTATRDLKEVKRAQRLGMKVLHRSEFLSELMQNYDRLLVAGTHGKTSTSALLVSALIEAELDPSFCIGGIHKNLMTNGRNGSGRFFVAEADESDGSFLAYHAHGAIVTNIDSDHLDHFGSLEKIKESFITFFKQIDSSEFLFWCGDDLHLREISPAGYSYGIERDNDLVISHIREEGASMLFDIEFQEEKYTDIELASIGRHQVYNASAVFGLCLNLGVDEKALRCAFASFQGVMRRIEHKLSLPYFDLYDDYAHHPTAVKATLDALVRAYPDRRLVVAFQPHRYSRLQAGLADFAAALEIGNRVFITPVFAAGEPPAWDINSDDLIDAINRIRPKTARSVKLRHLANTLIDELRPHDIFISLGAGDITSVHIPLNEHFKTHRAHPLRIGCIHGGCSSENQVSTWSWKNVAAALDPGLYQAEHFHIDIDGAWSRSDGKSFSFDDLSALDVALPILHGPGGEDGAIHGLFDMLGVPVAGCSILSSALAMDKDLMRAVVKSLGLKCVPWRSIWDWEYRREPEKMLARAEKAFGFPCFVKPVSLGSTDGVTCVQTSEELKQALEHLFALDTKVVVEPVMEMRELEFALLGSGASATALFPGEVFSEGRIYDFKSKYSADGPIKSTHHAAIEESIALQGEEIARTIYQAVGGSGLARLDFFYCPKKKTYYFNEMNPIPGFTDWSLYPKMLESSGYSLETFFSKVISDARTRGCSKTRRVARYR